MDSAGGSNTWLLAGSFRTSFVIVVVVVVTAADIQNQRQRANILRAGYTRLSSPSRMDFLEKFTRVGRSGPKTPRKNESIKHYLSCLWFISGQDNGASYRRRRRRWGTTSAFQKGLSGSGETSIFSIFHPKNEPSKQAAHGCLVLALPEGHSMNK